MDAIALVVLEELDDFVGICLSPIAGGTGRIGNAAKVPAVCVLACSIDLE